MYNYALARWEWRVGGDGQGFESWNPPAGVVGSLDLRPVAAMGAGAAEGFGFFALDRAADIPAGALLLGDDLHAPLKASARADAVQRLDLSPGDFDWPSLLDSLWGLLVELAEPSGASRARPLMPCADGDMRLRLGGHSVVRQQRYNAASHPRVIETARADFARYTSDASRKDAARRAEYLRHIAIKLGVRTSQIAAPSGGATIGDTFVEASNTSLDAHTPTGTYAFGGGWNENVGDWQVIAADDHVEVQTNGDPNIARAETDLDTDDHFAWSLVNAGFDFWAPGVAVRIDSAGNDCYIYRRDISNSLSHQIAKYVSGAMTNLSSVDSDYPDPANPWEARLQADGSDLEALQAGVSKDTVTDTSITGNTRAGLYAEGHHANSGIEYTEWRAEDVGGGGPPAAVARRGLALLGVGR
jgi:hypothetical protein